MARTRPFTLLYAPAVREHLRFVEAKHYGLIQSTILQQLQHQPLVETKDRKPLKRTPTAVEARWELRLGPGNRFRVFYEVDEEQHEVYIVAIGVKDRERLLIAGKDVGL